MASQKRATLRAPLPISAIIASVVSSLDGRQAGGGSSVDPGVWATAVGATLAAHSTPTQFQRGQLVVVVDHPAHLFTLNLQRQQLLRRLQAALGAQTIHGVSFTLVRRA